MAFRIKLISALRLAVLAAALLPAAGRAEPPPPARAPVLNDDAVPFLSAAGRKDYGRFLQQATPRAFALSPDGSWGWAAALETRRRRTPGRSRFAPAGAARAAASTPATCRW